MFAALASQHTLFHYCLLFLLLNMSHQWAAEDFCIELEHVSTLLETRPGSQVGQAALETLKQRLHAVTTWSPTALSDLYQKVSNANLPDAMKDEIMDSMDCLTTSGQTALQLSQTPQSLHNLPPFLTTKDWEDLEKGNTVDGQRIVCERLKSLGVKSMREDTKRTAIGVLLHVLVNVQHKPLPGPWQIYFMVQDLVRTFKYIPDTDLPGLKVYPVSPAQFNAAFKERAYGSEQPALRNVSLAAIYPKIPLRSTSHLLAGVPKPQKPPAENGVASSFQQRLEKFMDQYTEDRDRSVLQQRAADNTRGTTPLALQDASSPAAAEVLPLASPPQKPVANTLPNDNACLEDYENQAMLVLKARDEKKQVASKGMKRPAASKPPVKSAFAKASGPKKVATPSNALTVWGCRRCRGNPKGCETCWNVNFKGQRFNGRHEWNDAAAKYGWK